MVGRLSLTLCFDDAMFCRNTDLNSSKNIYSGFRLEVCINPFEYTMLFSHFDIYSIFHEINSDYIIKRYYGRRL